MKKILICFFVLVCIGLFGQGFPYGQEFKVNTYTKSSQSRSIVAALSKGGFVVVWESDGQDGDGYGVYGQLYDQVGTKMGGEFQVNTNSKYDQWHPSAAALSGGGFVVCWASCPPTGPIVYGQLYDHSGNRKGGELQINPQKLYDTKWGPSVASLSTGGFVVCWTDWMKDGSGWGVYGQFFDEYGVKKSEEFQANTYTLSHQLNPSVAALSGGGIIVCWESDGQDGDGNGVYGQLFDLSGRKKGMEFQVNTYTLYEQYNPTAAGLPGGSFVVCWEGMGNNSSGLWIAFYDASGNKQGKEYRVNTYPEGSQGLSTVAALSGGGFIVCWTSYMQDRSHDGIYGILYDASGISKGGEFKINTYDKNHTALPSIAAQSGGGFVVTWDSEGQNGSKDDIYAKRFPENPIVHKLIPFNLIEPLNDTSIKITDPTLKWQKSSEWIVCYPWELHYKIFVDDNPDFSSPELVELDRDTTLALQNLQPGQTYFWKVMAKNIAGDSLWSTNTNAFFLTLDAISGVEGEKRTFPDQFVMFQNYPNPFNPETTIRFDLPASGIVDISIYDITGKLIKQLIKESRTAGSHSVKWDGKDSAGNPVPSGIYICRMVAKSADGSRFVQSVKMGMMR